MKVTRKMLHKDLQSWPIFSTSYLLRFCYRNKWSMKIASSVLSKLIFSKPPVSIEVEERYLPTSDGSGKYRVKIYRPKGQSKALPPMLYTHGGGYIAGSPDVFDEVLSRFIECRPCVIVAPAYRNAFVKPYPAAFDDCYDTLLWMRDNAEELGIDPAQFIIAGHSAGGGLTAAVTLKARDTKDVKVAFQMPFYPMIDDLQPSDPERYIDAPGWDSKANAFGWASYLKDLHDRGEEIPAYAAPARNSDYRGFPPTITFIGEYEPFYWETIEYADQLKEAGVNVAFKIYPGATHGPEMLVPNSELGKDALAFTYDNYNEFYDKYISNL